MRLPVRFLLLLLLLALAAASADAATVSVGEPDVMLGTDALSVVPGLAEVNRVTITATTTDGGADVSDTGTPLVAGTGCVQKTPSTAHCGPLAADAPVNVGFVELGDKDDRIALHVPATAGWHFLSVQGGDGNDRLDATGARTVGDIDLSPAMQLELDGGGGRDTLLGGPGANWLAGGSGRDTLRGRGGADELDGDAPDENPFGFDTPARDVIDGGAGRDEVVYAAHPRHVVVNLRHPSRAGARHEGDRLSSIEDVVGTAFSDRLVGNGRANALTGYAYESFATTPLGGDVLIGDRGNDRLSGTSRAARLDGGRGNDRIALGGGFDHFACGSGRDTDEPANTPLLFGGRCERLDDGSYTFSGFHVSAGALRAHTRSDVGPDVG